MTTLAPLRLPAGPTPASGADGLVSGSRLKGAARAAAATVLDVLGQPPCQSDGDASCAVCRLFGGPGLEASVRWSALGPGEADPGRDLPLVQRRRQAVSRALGTSATAVPAVEAALPAGLILAGTARGWLPGTETAVRNDAAVLVAALRQILSLGGRSAGYGLVRVAVVAVQLGAEPLSPGDLLDALPVQEAR